MPGVILASSHHIDCPRPGGARGLGVRGGALSQLSAWSRPNKPARRGKTAMLGYTEAAPSPPCNLSPLGRGEPKIVRGVGWKLHSARLPRFRDRN